jgi:hypothetical protein
LWKGRGGLPFPRAGAVAGGLATVPARPNLHP